MPDDQQPGQAEEAGGAEAPATEPIKPRAGSAGDLSAVPSPGPAEVMVAVPAAEAAGAPEPKPAQAQVAAGDRPRRRWGRR